MAGTATVPPLPNVRSSVRSGRKRRTSVVQVPPLSLHLVTLHGFSTAANSVVPHNALHDARALRDHVVGLDL